MADTIFALASARGKAGVSVIRVSGPDALESAVMFGISGLKPRRATLRKLWFQGQLLDECLVLMFDEGASFTGECVVEFQVHGSVAIVKALLRALGGIHRFRHAEPGEFTRRALENGRLDLTQVEGLADLINSETEAQRRQAQRVLSGAIGQRAVKWRSDLVRAAALIEATIDFADEDIPTDVLDEVQHIVGTLIEEFRAEIEGSKVAERIRDGFEIAIIGPPNAGKSTLINALVGRDAAITSPIAGTTRDIIEVRMDLAGLPVTFLDTAGLRETEDPVEQVGIQRAIARAESADLSLFLVGPEDDVPSHSDDTVIVHTKGDLLARPGAICAVSGLGMDSLLQDLVQRLETRVATSSILTNERQRTALVRSVGCLESALQGVYRGEALELVAVDIRAAGTLLEQLVGKIGIENLLDEIFSSFCIGK